MLILNRMRTHQSAVIRTSSLTSVRDIAKLFDIRMSSSAKNKKKNRSSGLTEQTLCTEMSEERSMIATTGGLRDEMTDNIMRMTTTTEEDFADKIAEPGNHMLDSNLQMLAKSQHKMRYEEELEEMGEDKEAGLLILDPRDQSLRTQPLNRGPTWGVQELDTAHRIDTLTTTIGFAYKTS